MPGHSSSVNHAFADTQPIQSTQGFTFTGSGSEYFRIWIVNLMLTIVTLGIYSAWAKVRRTKYFYHNTVIDGSSFEYHGNPMSILKGRAIAVLLFVAYNTMVESGSGWLALLALVGLAAVLPWLLWKSLQFRAWNSSWRGVRFGFGGTTGEAYKTFLMWPVLAIVSLYLLLPYAHHQIKFWQHNRARFGQTSFEMRANVRGFYAAYLMALGAVVMGLVCMLVFGVFGALSAAETASQKAAALQQMMIGLGVIYLAMLAIGPMLAAKFFNIVWSHTQLGDHRFESRIPLGRAVFVGMTNLLGVICTLGLFIPWAAVRWAQLRAEHLVLHTQGSLEDFAATAQNEAKSLGEGVADLGDFDLGL